MASAAAAGGQPASRARRQAKTAARNQRRAMSASSRGRDMAKGSRSSARTSPATWLTSKVKSNGDRLPAAASAKSTRAG